MKLTAKVGLVAGALGCCSLVIAAEPTDKPSAAASQMQAAPARVIAGELTLKGTVQNVSRLLREIIIKVADGTTVTLKVNPDVVALNEIKKGDQVQVKYLQSVAFAIENAKTEAAAPVIAQETVQVTPEQGSMPGTAIVNTAAITAEVENIDQANRNVTLRDPEGNRLTMKAGPDVPLNQLKKGDQVLARYTEALAFEVRHG